MAEEGQKKMDSINVRIGSSSLPLEQADPQWIAQQIVKRRQAAESVCASVSIQTASLNMLLSTPQCGGGGGNRPPRPAEEQIFRLWKSHNLDKIDYEPGDLIAFTKQLRRLV